MEDITKPTKKTDKERALMVIKHLNKVRTYQTEVHGAIKFIEYLIQKYKL